MPAPADYLATVLGPDDVCAVIGTVGPGEPALSRIAGRQLGLITAARSRLAGVGADRIATRCASGAFRRLYRGVYLVGAGPMVPGAAELAAVLACGREAFVSHRSAAAVWGLAKPYSGAVNVTVVGRHCRSRSGLIVHRPRWLHPRDRATKQGIPVTAPGRTLVDLAADTTDEEMERALAEAYVRRIVTPREIAAAIERAPRHTRIGAVRGLLEESRGPDRTRSEAERQMLGVIRRARLTLPQANVRLGGYEVDFLWPAQRLIVEVDGHAFHGHRLAFERDRRRDAALVAAGYRVMRVTWRQLTEEPLAVVASLARALGPRT
jgi:very-short-patch-repair endonuclease